MNRGNIRHLIEQLTVGAGLLVDDRALDLVEASLKVRCMICTLLLLKHLETPLTTRIQQ